MIDFRKFLVSYLIPENSWKWQSKTKLAKQNLENSNSISKSEQKQILEMFWGEKKKKKK